MTDTAADLTLYHAVHRSLRRAPHRLAATAAALDTADTQRRRAFARYWHGYAGEVLTHHTIEDEIFFPALVGRVPGTRELIARTDAEHHDLDALMARTDAAVTAVTAVTDTDELVQALRDLAALMDRHLDFEDAEILPALAQHFTAEEYGRLDDAAKKFVKPGKQLAFTIAFVVAELTPEQLTTTLREAPLAFRLLHRLTRRSFARLEADVFGPIVADESEVAVA